MNRFLLVVVTFTLLALPSVVFAVDPLHRDSAFTLKDTTAFITKYGLLSDEEKAKIVPSVAEFILTYDKGGNDSSLSPEIDLTATVQDNIEVTLAVPYIFTRTHALEGLDKENGFSDVEFDLKWKLPALSNNYYSVAMLSALVLPTGSKSKGLGDGSASFMVGGVISKKIESLKLSAQIGFQKTGDNFKDFLIYGASGLYEFTPKFDLFAQVKGHSSAVKGSDDSTVITKFGFDYSFKKNDGQDSKYWQLTVGGARRLTTSGPDYRTWVDIAYNF